MKVKRPKRRAKVKSRKIVKKRPVAKKKIKKTKPSKKFSAKKKRVARKAKKGKPDKSARRILTGPSQSRRKASLVGKPKIKVVLKKRRSVLRKKNKPQKKIKLRKKTARRVVVKKIARKKIIIKIKPEESKIHLPVESVFKAKIRVIGIGGGGGSIVSEFGKSLEKTTFIIADTDIRALKKRTGLKYFWFGKELTHGLGTGVNPDLAREAAELEKEKIKELFLGQDIVILVASLGGGLGSGATQIFAEAAKSCGGITFGIFTLPFRFEGKNKARIAQKALKELRESLNVSIVIPNERIFKIINADTPITEAFSVVNKNLIVSLESLVDLIYNPGVINIDFADLRAILKGSGSSAFLNTVEESGKDRAEKVAEKVLHNPLYQNSNFQAEKILFNISGGQNLSMFEVEKISQTIGSAHPKAKIIFGISKNQKLRNRIKTTILMTGQGAVSPSEKPEAAPEVSGASLAHSGREKIPAKKPKAQKPGKESKKTHKEERHPTPAAAPVFNKIPIQDSVSAKLSVLEAPAKKTIRRSALEVKKALELEEDKRIDQEKEWEIPAFLRRVKFKS